MTTAAAPAIPARATGALSRWLSVRHPLHTEAAAVFALYVLYEVAHGLVVGNAAEAMRHARSLAATERSLYLLLEAQAAERRPCAPRPDDPARHRLRDASCHRHGRGPALAPPEAPGRVPIRPRHAAARERPLAHRLSRLPGCPPRLAGIGIADTVSHGPIDLNHGLVSSVYNPYAAVPSMHIGYALVVAVTLLRHGRRSRVRVLGALYPPFVLLIIVATRNHFFLDAAAGAVTAALAAALALLVMPKPRYRNVASCPNGPRRSASGKAAITFVAETGKGPLLWRPS